MKILTYFLDRGRIAEIRLPDDIDEAEKRKVFAHLRVDLLGEDMPPPNHSRRNRPGREEGLQVSEVNKLCT